MAGPIRDLDEMSAVTVSSSSAATVSVIASDTTNSFSQQGDEVVTPLSVFHYLNRPRTSLGFTDITNPTFRATA